MVVREVSVLNISTQNVAGGQVQNPYENLNIHGLMSQWKIFKRMQEDDNEIKKSLTVMFISSASQNDGLLQRYSSWSRLLKVI